MNRYSPPSTTTTTSIVTEIESESRVKCALTTKHKYPKKIEIDSMNVEKFDKVYEFKELKDKIIVSTFINANQSSLKFAGNSTILYVGNTAALKATNMTSIKAKVTYRDRKIGPVGASILCRQFELDIGIVKNMEPTTAAPSSCPVDSIPCSEFGIQEECSSRKRCAWIPSSDRRGDNNYSTCSSDPQSCPDGKCDAWEELSGFCPQDCTERSGKSFVDKAPIAKWFARRTALRFI